MLCRGLSENYGQHYAASLCDETHKLVLGELHVFVVIVRYNDRELRDVGTEKRELFDTRTLMERHILDRCSGFDVLRVLANGAIKSAVGLTEDERLGADIADYVAVVLKIGHINAVVLIVSETDRNLAYVVAETIVEPLGIRIGA